MKSGEDISYIVLLTTLCRILDKRKRFLACFSRKSLSNPIPVNIGLENLGIIHFKNKKLDKIELISSLEALVHSETLDSKSFKKSRICNGML